MDFKEYSVPEKAPNYSALENSSDLVGWD